MRLATFRRHGGLPRAGAVVATAGSDGVIDLAEATHGSLPADLLALLEAGPAALAEARAVANASTVDVVPLNNVEILAPLARPPKILAVAGNYEPHVAESALPRIDKRRAVPKLFLKPSTTILAPGAALVLPAISNAVDWEVELAVVMGKRIRDISASDALSAAAGYIVFNDISARKLSWSTGDKRPDNWDGFFEWLNGKWPDGFGPSGPWIVTSDEIPDPQDLRLELSVNGREFQAASTADMVFTVAELIAFASRIMTLEPGDILSTGTPAGVGDSSGRYLRPGDVIEARVEKVGVITTPVVAV